MKVYIEEIDGDEEIDGEEEIDGDESYVGERVAKGCGEGSDGTGGRAAEACKSAVWKCAGGCAATARVARAEPWALRRGRWNISLICNFCNIL